MSVNDKIADEIARHSIDLERFSVDLQNRVMPILTRVERDLAAEVAEFDPTGAATLSNRQKRLKALLRQTRGTIATGYGEISETVHDDLEDIAKLSDTAGRKIVNRSLGVEIMTVAIAPEQLRALADDTMIQGAVVKEHWDRQEAGLRQKFQDRVQDGFMRGESSSEIIDRVRGTKARGYTDGIMVGSKNAVGALVRTSVQAVANSARLETFKANGDIIKFVQHLSTLDNRTCLVADTPILTPTGNRPISEIMEGDVVIGGSGVPRLVLATPRAKSSDMVRITLDNGQTITCTADHQFLIEHNGRQIWVPAYNLFIGNEISSILKTVIAG